MNAVSYDWRKFAKVLDNPSSSDREESFAVESWANSLLSFFGCTGFGSSAPEYTDYMHAIGIYSRDNDPYLSEFYEEERWNNELSECV